jgi:hypothetical protein
LLLLLLLSLLSKLLSFSHTSQHPSQVPPGGEQPLERRLAGGQVLVIGQVSVLNSFVHCQLGIFKLLL